MLGGEEDEIRMLRGKEVSHESIAKIVGVSPTAPRHFVRARELDQEASA